MDADHPEVPDEPSFSAGLLPYVWMLCGAFAFALMAVCTHGLKDRCDWQSIALARSLIPLGLAIALLLHFVSYHGERGTLETYILPIAVSLIALGDILVAVSEREAR